MRDGMRKYIKNITAERKFHNSSDVPIGDAERKLFRTAVEKELPHEYIHLLIYRKFDVNSSLIITHERFVDEFALHCRTMLKVVGSYPDGSITVKYLCCELLQLIFDVLYDCAILRPLRSLRHIFYALRTNHWVRQRLTA